MEETAFCDNCCEEFAGPHIEVEINSYIWVVCSPKCQSELINEETSSNELVKKSKFPREGMVIKEKRDVRRRDKEYVRE